VRFSINRERDDSDGAVQKSRRQLLALRANVFQSITSYRLLSIS
jgi:hypothetical protein